MYAYVQNRMLYNNRNKISHQKSWNEDPKKAERKYEKISRKRQQQRAAVAFIHTTFTQQKGK